MSSIYGTISVKLDSKNRLKIPARFAELVSPYREVYFHKGLDGVFYLLMKPEWELLMEDVRDIQHPFNKQFNNFAEHFFNYAIDLNIDMHGRVTLPARVMELLGLSKDDEVMVQGRIDRLAISAKKAFEKRIKDTEADYEKTAAQLYDDGYFTGKPKKKKKKKKKK